MKQQTPSCRSAMEKKKIDFQGSALISPIPTKGNQESVPSTAQEPHLIDT